MVRLLLEQIYISPFVFFCRLCRLRSESRPQGQAHHDKHPQIKKHHEPIKLQHSKSVPSETKVVSALHASKETTISSLRAATAHTEVIFIAIDHSKQTFRCFFLHSLPVGHMRSLNQRPIGCRRLLVCISNERFFQLFFF